MMRATKPSPLESFMTVRPARRVPWPLIVLVALASGCATESETEPAAEASAPMAASSTPDIAGRVDEFTSWIEVDLDAIGANLEALRQHTGVEVMPVVKNNAYGHGLVPIVRYLAGQGVERVFVANVQEALELRQAGIDLNIVNMGPLFTDGQHMRTVELGITQVVFDDGVVQRLSDAAGAVGQDASVFVKVDTGLRRVGVFHDQAADFIERAASLPGIAIEGIFSTFMQTPEEDRAMLARLLAVETDVRARGIDPGLRSMASTDAILHFSESHLDLVRPGMSLYGIYPEEKDLDAGVTLTPALSLKARIELVKWVDEGDSVTYWGRFIAPRRMMIATVHAGFYDGVPRELANVGSVFYAGEFRDIIGSVSLNHVVVDVTGTDASPGDTVEVIGHAGPNAVSAIAETANWMVYSLLNHLNPQTPRVYYQGGEPAALLEP
ncbi:MAG: alanine racemase [Acidobacteria bacterium]|nr:alanine racemase [Acidobacteriota bacterium]